MMTEQEVLQELGIPDFRYLTKDKVITMASMLDKMEPDVAKKVLEQFPQYSSTIKEILFEYQKSLDKVSESNKTSVQSYYNSCHSIIETLQKLLDKEDLSFEQRQYICDKMVEVTDKMSQKDSENKNFLLKIGELGALVASVAFVVVGSVLGVNTIIKK